ncbi:restriction endonuclease subunit S [Pseudarthrobacter sp. alpha12b]
MSELEADIPFLQGNAEFGPRHPSAKFQCSAPPKSARTGDVLVSVRAPVGALNIADRSYGIGRGLAAVRPLVIDSEYLWWWLHTQVEVLQAESTGSTFAAIPASDIANLTVPVTDSNLQRAIARFLGRETAQIDELIEKQERLIDLLAEKRQAMITHAVTKGLDPTATTKPSGIPWLGDIGVDFEPIQLGRLTRKVADGPHFSPQYVDNGGVMFLSARNIRVDSWSLTDAKFVSESDYEEFSKRIVPEKGDVLYTKGGTTGIARVVDLDQKFQVWVHVAVLKIRRELADPHYVAYALNSHGGYDQSQLHTRGATNQDLGLTRMIRIWMALPDLAAQKRIVRDLDLRTAKIDQLIDKASSTAAILYERRSALISAAVTGKINVTNEGVAA